MMHSLTVCCVLMVAAAASDVDGFSDVGAKLRRIPGMMPRPFVGRSNPAATWLVDLTDVADMGGRPKRAEIAGMFPYPRVGRSNTEDQDIPGERIEGKRLRLVAMSRFPDFIKRGREAAGVPLWFGPRLGKRLGQSPWPNINIREVPPKNQEAAFTPRLGRESEEDPNEDYDSKSSLTDRL